MHFALQNINLRLYFRSNEFFRGKFPLRDFPTTKISAARNSNCENFRSRDFPIARISGARLSDRENFHREKIHLRDFPFRDFPYARISDPRISPHTNFFMQIFSCKSLCQMAMQCFFHKAQPVTLKSKLRLQAAFCFNQHETSTSKSGIT